ncbi:unnamed protein product [Microthlaspi erraticum]|uniref:MATH domain-containing protein n=1 Tax=Microthlaspi erraticum TaxID=1685480 RepID=A0A6D2JL01_9BRAS|nr:unnamed protein product [Microthlaspi erraticum]
MEDQKQTSFTFEIDNFSEKEAMISSPTFSSGGCQWYVRVYPKVDDHLSLYLRVANPESLPPGWKRRATYSLVLLNQSRKEFFRTDEFCSLFCAQFSSWGFPKAVPLKKIQAKGFLEKNKLIVKVELKVVDEGDAIGNEKSDVNGFLVLSSQVDSLSRLFVEHPDFAVNFRPKNQQVKTTYINILLDLIETLKKPPHSISETELSNAHCVLIDLTDVGFKLHWLKTKLDEVSLERKKSNGDDTQVQELEEHIKNLNAEVHKEKVKSATCAAKVLSLEHTVSVLIDQMSDLKDEVSDLRDELNKEKTRSVTSAAEVWSLEQTVSDLKDELNKEKGKVLSLEQTVLSLRDDLKKEKGVVSSWEVLDYA